MKKRIISLILATMMLISGCGTAETTKDNDADVEKENAEDADAAGDEETAESDFSEHITVEISMWEMVDWGNDAISAALEDKFNCDIECVVQEWSDYQDKFAAWAASDTLPQSFAGYPAAEAWFPQFVNDEMLREIPLEMIEKYPNVLATCEASEAWATLNEQYDGKIYTIPRNYSASGLVKGNINGFMYRTDWAEAVGVTEVPTNMDDFYDLMLKFVTEDPDGNGKDDTYGIVGDWKDMCQFFNAYPNDYAWVELEDGTFVPGYLDEEPMLNALNWMRKAYESGVLDPEFSKDRTKWTQGIFGAWYRQMDTYWLQRYIKDEMGAAYPEKGDPLSYVGIIPALAEHEGEEAVKAKYKDDSATVFAYDTTDEELDRLLAIYDYLLSEEGNRLRYCGIEGEDYTLDADGNVTMLHTDSLREKYPSIFIQNWPSWDHDYVYMSDPFYGEEYKALETQVLEESNAAAENSTISWNASYMQTDEKREFVFDFEEKLVSIITGTEPVEDMYAAFVAEAEANGVQDVIDSVNNAIAK